MSRPHLETLSQHAKGRKEQRNIPDYLLDMFHDGLAFIAQGRKHDGVVTNYHVIRTGSKAFVVGVERDNLAVTFICVNEPYGWFKNRIFNFDHIYRQIRRLPVVENETCLPTDMKDRRTKSTKEIVSALLAGARQM